jgi:drug/metabolite transporter (DMT)-like permease
LEPHLKKSYWALHTAVFLFGFTGILGRLISLDSEMLVWYRMWMTAIMMGIFVTMSGKMVLLPLKATLHIAAISISIALHWVLFYASIKLASVSIAMVCLSSIALFTALLEPIILKQKFESAQIFFSLLVIIGVFLMAKEQEEQVVGIIIGLVSSFFSALFTVLNKTIIHKYDSRLLSFYEIGCGFIILTLILPLTNFISPIGNVIPTQEDWWYLFNLSFFCTVVAFNLSLSSLRFLSPFTVNLAINLEPIYGIILAFIVFKEYELLGTGFYIGAVIILISVVGETIWKRYKIWKSSTPGVVANSNKNTIE